MTELAHTGQIAKAQAAYGRQARDRLPTCGGGCIMRYDLDSRELVIIPITCHKWSCAYCAPERLRAAQRKARAGHPERHIVLSMRPIEGLYTKRHIAHCWASFRKLIARARKAWGPMEYMAALELHKNGAPHLHVLQRGAYVSQQWLSKTWCALTGNYIVHIKQITNTRAAINELTKYLAKTASAITKLLPGKSPITTSRGWVLDPPDVDPAHAERNFLTLYSWVHAQDLEASLLSLGAALTPSRGPPGRFQVSAPSSISEETLNAAMQQAFIEEDRPMVLAVSLLRDPEYVDHELSLREFDKATKGDPMWDFTRRPYSPGPAVPF